MKPYKEYKDSGVPWIGKIPKDWEVKKLKYIFKINMGQSPDTDKCNDDKIGMPFLQGKKDFGVISPIATTYCTEPKKIALVNDIMMSVRAPVGDINIADVEYCIGRGLCALTPLKMNLDYSWYILSCISEPLKMLSTGTTYEAVSIDDIKNIYIVYPKENNQSKISDYLDRKTAAIDTLIEDKQKMIELLKERRQAIISEAVTKGLDKNAKMKDSGIEWIGEIPESYQIIKMRYLIADYKAGPFGSSLITDKLLDIGNILCYTPEHIARGSTDNEKNLYLPEERREEMSQFFVKAGDVIFSIVGSLGRAMIITENMPKGIINQRLAKFSILSDKVNTEYFMWLFAKSRFFEPFIQLFQRGSIIVNLTKNIVYDMPFIIPSTIEEQKEIVEYLDKKTTEIDNLISDITTQIEKLKEYRQAIISEAVTGKVEI